MQGLQLIIIGVVIVVVVVIAIAAGPLTENRLGRWVLLAGLALLPLVVTGAGVAVGVRESSQTQFCMSCHEMEPYGKSLFVDNDESLAAVHYQKRLIARDATCYACHTDYAMFGTFKAKLNGLKHVWVHYARPIPERPKLYNPYPNYNCLHCHADARPFIEAPSHQDDLPKILSGEKSCLECHELAHDHQGVKDQKFWVPPEAP